MRIIMFTALLLLAAGSLAADDLDASRQKAEKKNHADTDHLVIGVLPNTSGNVDGYIGARLNYTRRLFTRIILDSTGVKETQDAFRSVPLGLNAILDQQFHLNCAADLLGWRFVHKNTGKKKGQRISLAAIAYGGYTVSSVQRRESYIFTDLTAVLNREHLLNLVQGFGKLQFTWSRPGKYFVRLYGGGGLFLGFLDQRNTIYWNELGTEINDSYRADQQIAAPGWMAGAETMFNPGPFTLRLSGDILRSQGTMEYIYFNIGTGTNTVGEDPFRYISWNIRVELTLNFISLGKNHPSAFYGISRQGLQIEKAGGWVDLTSENTKTELVHKFGVMMRY